MKKIVLGLLAIILTVIYSCNTDENLLNENEKTATTAKMARDNDRVSKAMNEFAGKKMTTAVLAEIQDVDGNSISGAIVKIGNEHTMTNENGVAVITSATINEKFAYVTAEKDGYFVGSRVFIPHSAESNVGNQVKIKLFRMENPQEIDANSPNTVTVSTPYGEGRVNFNGGFVDESGNPYNGSVKVFTQYLDPLNPETAYTMPGDLLGMRTNGEIGVLGSFGMVNVELRGEAGQELQISNPAEIRLPIAPDQMATAPDDIPMWYFSESSGLWIEEGVGNKIGNEYVTNVNHFTHWNFDNYLPHCSITIYITDQNGTPLNVTDDLYTVYNNTHHYGSAPQGMSEGHVPANKSMVYTATFSHCGSTYTGSFSFTTGATGSSQTYNLVINVPNIWYRVSGVVNICPGITIPAASTGTWVVITTASSGTFMVPSLRNPGGGSFYGFQTNDCSPTISIFATNWGYNSPTTTLNLNLASTTTHNMNIGGCTPEFIRYSIDGGAIITDNVMPAGGITFGTFSIQAEDSSANKSILVSQTASLGMGYMYGSGPNQMEFTRLSDPLWAGSTNHNISFDLTNIGGIGMPIEVQFTGTFDDSSGNIHTITGNTYILRDF